MSEIRALTEDDLDSVDQLLSAHLPNRAGDRDFLAATALNHPWADPDIPSLVATVDGSVVGFIAAQVRRIRFNGESLRGVCCSHLVVAPDTGAGAAGALLLQRLLRGPQAATWSDSANEPVVRIWRRLGGHLDHSRACDWMLVLRSGGWLGHVAATALRRGPVGREIVPVPALPMHLIAQRPGARDRAAADPDVRGEDVGATEIAAHLPEITRHLHMHVDHDAEYLEQLLNLIRTTAGPLVCRLVRRGDQPIGWYAYLSGHERVGRVLHLSASDADVDAVFAEMIQHGAASGVRVLAGRLEPHLDRPLQRRFAIIGLARQPVLHVRDPELRATLGTASSLLTQLDSEWFVT